MEKGNSYTDPYGITHYRDNTGVETGTSYKDAYGITHYRDRTGIETGNAYQDAYGNTHYRNQTGIETGNSHTDPYGITHYRNNTGVETGNSYQDPYGISHYRSLTQDKHPLPGADSQASQPGRPVSSGTGSGPQGEYRSSAHNSVDTRKMKMEAGRLGLSEDQLREYGFFAAELLKIRGVEPTGRVHYAESYTQTVSSGFLGLKKEKRTGIRTLEGEEGWSLNTWEREEEDCGGGIRERDTREITWLSASGHFLTEKKVETFGSFGYRLELHTLKEIPAGSGLTAAVDTLDHFLAERGVPMSCRTYFTDVRQILPAPEKEEPAARAGERTAPAQPQPAKKDAARPVKNETVRPAKSASAQPAQEPARSFLSLNDYLRDWKADPTQSVRTLRADAKDGSTDAMLVLGLSYMLGRGNHPNMDEAMRRVGLAADKGNSAAAYLLARMSRDGIRIGKDNNRMRKRMVQAAEAGYLPAVEDMIRMIEDGTYYLPAGEKAMELRKWTRKKESLRYDRNDPMTELLLLIRE